MAGRNPGEAGEQDDVLACFELLPTAVWAFEGPEHRVVAVNRAARDRLADRRDLLGLPVRTAIPEIVGQHLFDQLDRVYATGERLVGREWRVLVESNRDGTMDEVFFDFVLVPRFAGDGSVRGVVAQCVDVTAAVLRRREAAHAVPEPLDAGPDVAVTMQRALLPAGLPVLPQVGLAAQYRVAEKEVAAGGDWFDAVPLGRGRVALTVGDVVGHGEAAVAAMGQLRAILTDALLDGLPAAEALSRLNRFAGRVRAARAATACLAVLDPAAEQVEYGGFAHPAPLIVGEGGKTRFLAVVPSRPLGVADDPPVMHSSRLTAGEVMLLYSDGLVQRPGRTMSDGMNELASVASAAMWETSMTEAPGPVADRVCGLAVERLTRLGIADDVTLLAAELRAEPHRPLVLELPAEAVWLRGIRRALDEWLHGVGAGPDDVPSVHLAVVEAATNCVEHAYQGAGGWMWLDVVLDGDGRLRATVTDHGRWRPPPPESEHRGRGLRLMHSLMETVDVHRADRGTTVTMSKTLQRPAVFSAGAPDQVGAGATVDFATEVRAGPRPCLVVAGPLDMSTAGSLLNRISELSRGGVLPVDVDLSAVTHLASAGVQVLYDCARAADGEQGWVRLLVPEGCPARYVLTLNGLDGVFEVLTDPPPD
ncbi:MAG TPA: SpoIIE family protein phosphatase [Pseudonocardiaceae bacterium]